MLKRIGAGAAIAWTAPIVISIRAPAFADYPCASTCNTGCAGDFCDDQSYCNVNNPACFLNECACAQPFGCEGFGVCQCYCNDLCVNRTPCPDGSCPEGQLCLHTCCDEDVGSAVCLEPCTPGVRTGSRRPKTSPSGGLTALGYR